MITAEGRVAMRIVAFGPFLESRQQGKVGVQLAALRAATCSWGNTILDMPCLVLKVEVSGWAVVRRIT